MTSRGDAGFSLVEVIVAIVILTVGILALAQTSGTVTTMIGRGKHDTQAALAAQAQLERLRHVARATDPGCTALANGSATGPAPGTTTTWTVAGTGHQREVTVTVTYRIARGSRSETVHAVLGCV